MRKITTEALSQGENEPETAKQILDVFGVSAVKVFTSWLAAL